ncbi:MAG TPA: cyclopropane-fatty-acyl-phospholipid synthase family protein [Burkholderiaceae bacterium]|nr:cyclopropane-fatty-acyl-phospholipid synthase family protein [Burkholderiaceae bacterium]
MSLGLEHSLRGGPAAGLAPAIRIVERLLHGFEVPLALRLWNGAVHAFTPDKPLFTLVLRDPAWLRRLVMERSPVWLAHGYFSGLLDVEGDLYSALALKGHFESIRLSWRDKLALLRDALRLPLSGSPAATLASRIAQRFSHRHSRDSDQAAITFHYDVSNAFYALWLDEQRVYSCAYFEHPDDTLDQAQRNKLEHICRKLRLRPGEQLLDIGCGWGALVCWAARHHGVRAHGITLSRQQLDHARRRIRDEGLTHLVSVELRDYRDLPAEAHYDKIASVGMFEHVGLANLPAYLATVHRVLRPGGLFLNHGITHDEEGWNKTVAAQFINRYVFPDGELDRISNIQLGMERAGFEIHDVEGLRPHYALTLRHWVQRLEARRDAALQEVDEPTYRVWRLYMAACALEFEAGGTGIYQVLASRRDQGRWPVPLTRRDLYALP